MKVETVLKASSLLLSSAVSSVGLHLNFLSTDPSTRFLYGKIGDYVGDFYGGSLTALGAASAVLLLSNHDERIQRVAAIIVLTVGISLVCANEIYGFGGGSPFIEDLVAPAIGLIAGCGVLQYSYELFSRKKFFHSP